MKKSITIRFLAYVQIMLMGAQITFVYRANAIFQLAGVIFQVYLLKVIWTAIYLHSSTSNQIQLSSLISYLTLTNIQTWILAPTITNILQDRIRTGDIALDIAKPVNFLTQLIAQQLGKSLSLVPFAILALPL